MCNSTATLRMARISVLQSGRIPSKSKKQSGMCSIIASRTNWSRSTPTILSSSGTARTFHLIVRILAALATFCIASSTPQVARRKKVLQASLGCRLNRTSSWSVMTLVCLYSSTLSVLAWQVRSLLILPISTKYRHILPAHSSSQATRMALSMCLTTRVTR